MPMFISNTKLLYKPKSFFHCRPPLKGGELTQKSRELADKEVALEVKKLDEKIVAVGMKRGNYEFYTPQNKVKVAKYAAEYGVTSSL